jgi:hypothetical protein
MIISKQIILKSRDHLWLSYIRYNTLYECKRKIYLAKIAAKSYVYIPVFKKNKAYAHRVQLNIFCSIFRFIIARFLPPYYFLPLLFIPSPHKTREENYNSIGSFKENRE